MTPMSARLMDGPGGQTHNRFQHSLESVMKKPTPYLANGCPKTCWGCGQPFGVRHGRAEAIVGASGRLYCHRIGCEQTALVSHVYALQRVGVARAA
jgi:hypothetical protein